MFSAASQSTGYKPAGRTDWKSMFRYTGLPPLKMTTCERRSNSNESWPFVARPLYFLRSHNEMDNTVRRGDEEAVEIFAQLLDFVAARDAVNF